MVYRRGPPLFFGATMESMNDEFISSEYEEDDEKEHLQEERVADVRYHDWMME